LRGRQVGEVIDAPGGGDHLESAADQLNHQGASDAAGRAGHEGTLHGSSIPPAITSG
jgi:hypothetical protein